MTRLNGDLRDNEQARLNALRDLNLLDTPPSESYDRLTRLASELLKAPVSTISLTDSDRQQFERPAEQLLRYLLFVNEAPLSDSGAEAIDKDSAFAREFGARGPRDRKGRSLRDFDLQTRIFKYPCSYLIYSDDFDSLPSPAKEYVYHRLLEVLTGRDESPDFAKLTKEDRQAILEILLSTKKGLPEEWKKYAEQANGHQWVPGRSRLEQSGH